MKTIDKTNQIIEGDARSKLKELSTDSVDCVITSPPYFRLRDYGEQAQIGLENTVDDWVTEIRIVLTEVARVLKPSGSLWLNLGDSYSRNPKSGAPAKSLLLGPERLLLALAADGWIIRNKVVWAKTNPMPASVGDRLSSSHEFVYFLTRSAHYFFDLDAVRVPPKTKARAPTNNPAYPPVTASPPSWAGPLAGNNRGLGKLKQAGRVGHPLGKNPGDVWRLPTASYHGAHFATCPKSLVETPLLATCPERVCGHCGLPWTRSTARSLGALAVRGELKAACACDHSWRPGLVLDPFFGAGTVGLVAEEHRRDWLGVELHPEFAQLATTRLAAARARRDSHEGKKAA